MTGKSDAAIIFTKPEKTVRILEELKYYGEKYIWLQRGSADEEILQKANKDYKFIVCNKCILMFANPPGIQGFHSSLVMFFEGYPK